MPLDVLVLTDSDDFEAALPALTSFSQTLRRMPLTDSPNFEGEEDYDVADVAIIDARTDLAAAQTICRRLTTNTPATATVALVGPADGVTVDADSHFDDVMLPRTGAEEMQARLQLAINRRRSAVNGTLKFGDLLLYPASCTGSLDGKDLGLTVTEFRLLNFLVLHAGRAFTRTRLMHEAWGYDCNGRIRTIDVHVRRLRAKLGAEHKSVVDTVRGVGYMAVTPPQPEWIVGDPIPTAAV
jgi:DNA-binding response OmpR family regulator